MDLYVIAGPNGTGKTTFANKFLPKYANCPNFINADVIAESLSLPSPDMAARRAGRIVLAEIVRLAHSRVPFAFETTLSGRSYLRLIGRLKEQGYRVHLFFLWVDSIEMTLSRIRERVLKGGQEEKLVHRRFE